jgi:hypothetical protein
MNGCTEYSGEYREPWSKNQRIEFFIQIFGVVTTAWFTAMKGYFINQKRRLIGN